MAAGLSIADVADRMGKEHRLKAVGRLDRGTLQYQVLANTQIGRPAGPGGAGDRREERPADSRAATWAG